MMEMAKVTSKGQITIPISIRRRLSINEGDKILFINKTDGVLMVNPDSVQGDLNDYTADSVPIDAPVAAPAKAAEKPMVAEAPAPAPAPAPAAAPASPVMPAPPAYTPPPATTAPPPIAPVEPPRRKYIPPVADIEEKPAAQAGGINLSSLLDDIRSLGSNVD